MARWAWQPYHIAFGCKVVMPRRKLVHYHLPLQSKVQALPACTPERSRLHMSFRLAQQRAAMVSAKFMMATLGRPETARALVFNKDLLLVPKGDGCITGVFAPVGAHATQRGPALRMKRGCYVARKERSADSAAKVQQYISNDLPTLHKCLQLPAKLAHNWIPLFAVFKARAWRKPMGQVT